MEYCAICNERSSDVYAIPLENCAINGDTLCLHKLTAESNNQPGIAFPKGMHLPYGR